MANPVDVSKVASFELVRSKSAVQTTNQKMKSFAVGGTDVDRTSNHNPHPVPLWKGVASTLSSPLLLETATYVATMFLDFA